VTLRVPFAEVHGMSMALERNYEPELTERISHHIRPGDVVVDVGANMGYFTLLASKLVGNTGLVIAFEPCPGNLRWLSYNVSNNGRSNVLLQSTALANESGLRQLTVPPVYNNGVSSLRDRQNGHTTTPAWVARFDELPFASAYNSRISLVKVDTEGLEISVMKGMRSLLSSPNPRLAIACELSPAWYDVAELFRLLSDADFGGEYFSDGRWIPLRADSLPSRQCNAWFERKIRG
jgi:FkbM family methyltransferase